MSDEDGYMTKNLNRREFLKVAAAGAAGVASVTLLPPFVQGTTAIANGATSQGVDWAILAQSKGSKVGNIDHRMIMSGEGKVDPAMREVKGSGSFNHFDNSTLGPKTILSSGQWVATKLVDFNMVKTWGDGPFAAAVLEMTVNLNQSFPSPATIPATLKIVSNIGSAGLSTKQREGFTLTIPSAPLGPFSPLPSRKRRKGLAVFTLGIRTGAA